ncbi:hypothetical protein QBC35DRAFT_468981 [Podospora australis]|uniref:Uncharacterized protein n=1 Tax=Podospora australis TaxID=1536484 RepID=A0AAN6X5K4_9PEZI|nr:hypothetical protein QBC35DRAFT_468981 [Podospora australis]
MSDLPPQQQQRSASSMDYTYFDPSPSSPTAPGASQQPQQVPGQGNYQLKALWNTPKFQNEYEHAKARALHADFSCAGLPDPLLPRPSRPAHNRTAAVDPETEEKLKAIIAEAKASVAGR